MNDLITIKVRPETHAKLKELKRLTGVSFQHRLDELVTADLRRAKRAYEAKAAA